jgi:NAD(P)-dependent dehydrogenase (short-subunit alcohol dehydrogenase family)
MFPAAFTSLKHQRSYLSDLCPPQILTVLQVNSAGIQIPGSIETAKLEDYDRQMNTNVRSLFVLTQLAVPHLIKTKGNIVNISSVAGLRSVSSFRIPHFVLQILDANLHFILHCLCHSETHLVRHCIASELGCCISTSGRNMM